MAAFIDTDGLVFPVCPDCDNKGDFATVEVLRGYCAFTGFDPESAKPEWGGYTEVDWDSSKSMKSKSGQWRILCNDCDHVFWWRFPGQEA